MLLWTIYYSYNNTNKHFLPKQQISAKKKTLKHMTLRKFNEFSTHFLHLKLIVIIKKLPKFRHICNKKHLSSWEVISVNILELWFSFFYNFLKIWGFKYDRREWQAGIIITIKKIFKTNFAILNNSEPSWVFDNLATKIIYAS